LHSNEEITMSKDTLLPEISRKGQGSIKGSIERMSKDTKVPSVQDNYDKHVDDFKYKLRDPKFRNNSFGIAGIFSGGY